MNQERFAYRVRQMLNHSARDLSPAANRRLAAARHLALSKQKQPAHQMVLAGVGSSIQKQAHQSIYIRQVLAILALLLGMWISFYWHSVQYVSELEAVDSAMLADELPPEAFLDNDFIQWLIDDSSDD